MKCAAQTVNVGTVIDIGQPQRLFGRHVIDRSHDRPSLRQGARFFRGPANGIVETGQAEIGYFDDATRVAQQVCRLDITVVDSLGVRIGHAPGGLHNTFDGLADRQRPAFLHSGRQIAAVDEFHDQKVAELGFIGVVGHDDVGMTQPSERLNFALEPQQMRRGLAGGAR